ncbi:Hypothetical protein R9X50_00234700 [Acrodontium crateriforme]|uniref:Microbial-type PARG catalytic domain-containing protein n=1 Tax=Acrodontium crateriforme TaxID=150365 RepID=A0AAQ3RAW3_9PEZI|nr:Hypothetical protein R9X50_00234700 [Acrodontium crateriforme]
MGRTAPTLVVRPSQNRRDDRAKRAKDTLNRVIPDVLRSSPRARHAIHQSAVIKDPQPESSSSSLHIPGNIPRIRLQCTDTLRAASQISERPFVTRRNSSVRPANDKEKKHNVAILNMASPLKPGGGFLDGANSQEEFLCARSTLYPSLWDHFYRLPELGGVFTPDVMVFRDSTPEANDLDKRDRFFVDVISAGMIRFPDINKNRSEDREEGGCSCGVSYCDTDRELVTRKMKAVMRIAQSKGTEKLILGAWGCGAYGNPVKEVAKIWRKVIAGSPRQRRPNAEQWEGIREIIFAIPDRTMLREFEIAFGDLITNDPSTPLHWRSSNPRSQDERADAQNSELMTKIAETEMQMELTSSSRIKARLRDVLANLNRELSQGQSAKLFKDDELTLEEDEETEQGVDEDGFVVSGFAASDGEENSFYHFDENDVASDSSDCGASDTYEFRPEVPRIPSRPTRTRSRAISTLSNSNAPTSNPASSFYDTLLPPGDAFDANTGWYSGSIDEFHSFMRHGTTDGPNKSHTSASPSSPDVVRPDSGDPSLQEERLRAYLERFVGREEDRD